MRTGYPMGVDASTSWASGCSMCKGKYCRNRVHGQSYLTRHLVAGTTVHTPLPCLTLAQQHQCPSEHHYLRVNNRQLCEQLVHSFHLLFSNAYSRRDSNDDVKDGFSVISQSHDESVIATRNASKTNIGVGTLRLHLAQSFVYEIVELFMYFISLPSINTAFQSS